MKQTVNLYLPAFRKIKPLLSVQAMLAVAAILSVGLLLAYGYRAWSLAVQEKNLVRLQAERQAGIARLEVLGGGPQPDAETERLQGELRLLVAEKTRKSDLLQLLNRGGTDQNAGFSRHFEGLARQRIDGLWLTHVAVYSGGGQIALRGVTLAESLIPRYLQKLEQEAAFAGTEFQQIRLERPADKPGVTFELRTAAVTERATDVNP